MIILTYFFKYAIKNYFFGIFFNVIAIVLLFFIVKIAIKAWKTADDKELNLIKKGYLIKKNK